MEEVRKIIENSSTSVTIDLPKEYQNRKLEVVVIAVEEPIEKYDLLDLSGKLQWKGDALVEQTRLRNEWE